MYNSKKRKNTYTESALPLIALHKHTKELRISSIKTKYKWETAVWFPDRSRDECE